MFGYKRPSAYGGKRYYRTSGYYRPYKRGGSAARAYASARSSKAGTKTETYNGQVNGYVRYVFSPNQYRSNVQMFMPYRGSVDDNTGNAIDSDWSVHGGALNDRTFRLLCAQYDQCRLVSMKVKLLPTNLTTTVAPVKLMSVCDRNNYVAEMNGDGDDPRMSAMEIENNAGVLITDINGNRTYPVIRYCTARDLKERTDYIDSSIEYPAYTGHEDNPLYDMRNIDWRNGRCHFCPCFYTCMKTGVTSAEQVTLIYSYTVEYNFIFRNPKNDLENFIATEILVGDDSKRLLKIKSKIEEKLKLKPTSDTEDTMKDDTK